MPDLSHDEMDFREDVIHDASDIGSILWEVADRSNPADEDSFGHLVDVLTLAAEAIVSLCEELAGDGSPAGSDDVVKEDTPAGHG